MHALFDAVGALWQSTFAYAHELGVQTCIGTETPITPPPLPAGSLLPLNVYFSAVRDDHYATTMDCDDCDGLYVLVGTAGEVIFVNTAVYFRRHAPLDGIPRLAL